MSKIVDFALALNPNLVFGNYNAHELGSYPFDVTEFVIMTPKTRPAKFLNLFSDLDRGARVVVEVNLDYNKETDSDPSQVKLTCYRSGMNRGFAQALAEQIGQLGIETNLEFKNSSFNTVSYD